MRSLGKLYPSLGISHNLLMGLGVSDFVSVGHIFAFISSRYTFSSRARNIKIPVSASLGFTTRHPYISLLAIKKMYLLLILQRNANEKTAKVSWAAEHSQLWPVRSLLLYM